MLRVENLSKHYSARRAVDNISFSLKSGEVTALLGINGAGKTTTLRMLTGYITPTSGSVFIGGENIIDEREKLLTEVGYLPENPALYNDMTVEDFLIYMYRLRLATRENESAAVERALTRCALGERRHDYIASLSAGFRKRVGLAQAIIHEPKVLLLDEPIADLDPRQIREIKSLLREFRTDHAILVSSHILKEVHEFADRILLMHGGRILADAQTASIPAGDLENWFMQHTEAAA
ncbi:MAG: ABC transporter ATP-binding protein [Leptospiraceae bacterium]|nr:ABC transporter ATP-binding protein [Leptospiraceae bacterium]